MTTPALHDFALDVRGYAVRLIAALAGITLEVVDVDVVPGEEHLGERLIALNPRGTTPVLVDGETVLTEPAAMALHLSTGTPLEPSSTEAMDWLIRAAILLDRFASGRSAALFEPPSPVRDAAIGLARQATAAGLREWEDRIALMRLSGGLFVQGKTLCIADVLAFPVFAQSRDLQIEPEAYPALRLWARSIRALPGFIGMPGIPDYH